MTDLFDSTGEEPAGDPPDDSAPPPPYEYDPGHAALAAPVFEEAALTLADPYDLSAVADAAELAGLDDERLRRELVAVGLYRITIERGEGQPGGTLEPLETEEAGWHLVCPIRSTTEDVRKLWEDLSSLVSESVPSARLHDLCFSARQGQVGSHGVAAVGAYLQWPTSMLNPLHVSEGIARAWTIARAMQSDQLEHEACLAAHDYADAQLAGDGNPGTVFPLLKLLCTAARNGAGPVNRATVAGLLVRAHARFEPSYLRVQIARMQRRLATDDTQREAADRVEVQAHLDEAQRSDSASKVFHLQTAAQAARNLGVKDLEQQAVAELQNIPADELDMARIRSKVDLPLYLIASVLRPFDEADDWRGALHQFLHTDCPSGSYNRNREQAQSSIAGSLRGLFPTLRFGAHGLPQQSATTADEKLDMEISTFEVMSLDNSGRWFAAGLARMPDVYGIPDTDEIVAFLIDVYRCDQGMATGFATALRLFWCQEYSASLHLSVPRVEEGVRRLLLLLNEPVYRVEKGKTIGQFPGLGSLLPLLVNEGFDRDWERYLGALLLPRGHNLRNLVAHGFVDGISPGHAASALRAAGLMTLASPAADASVDPQTIRRNLRNPLATADVLGRLHPARALARRLCRFLRRRGRPGPA